MCWCRSLMPTFLKDVWESFSRQIIFLRHKKRSSFGTRENRIQSHQSVKGGHDNHWSIGLSFKEFFICYQNVWVYSGYVHVGFVFEIFVFFLYIIVQIFIFENLGHHFRNGCLLLKFALIISKVEWIQK